MGYLLYYVFLDEYFGCYLFAVSYMIPVSFLPLFSFFGIIYAPEECVISGTLIRFVYVFSRRDDSLKSSYAYGIWARHGPDAQRELGCFVRLQLLGDFLSISASLINWQLSSPTDF